MITFSRSDYVSTYACTTLCYSTHTVVCVATRHQWGIHPTLFIYKHPKEILRKLPKWVTRRHGRNPAECAQQAAYRYIQRHQRFLTSAASLPFNICLVGRKPQRIVRFTRHLYVNTTYRCHWAYRYRLDAAGRYLAKCCCQHPLVCIHNGATIYQRSM